MPKLIKDYPTPTRMMTIPQVCSYLGQMSAATFYTRIEPHVRSCMIGRRRMVDKESVDSFIARQMEMEQSDG